MMERGCKPGMLAHLKDSANWPTGAKEATPLQHSIGYKLRGGFALHDGAIPQRHKGYNEFLMWQTTWSPPTS